MGKVHWKPKRTFGRSSGRHSHANKLRKVTYRCVAKEGLVLKLRKRVPLQKCRSFKRKLLSKNVIAELKSLYQCVPSGDIMKLCIRKAQKANVKGYRFINIENLETQLNLVMKHCALCKKCREMTTSGLNALSINNERRTHGLATVLEITFLGCKEKHCFESSPKLKSNNSFKYDINVRAVWGSITTGNGASHLKEIMATMDAPSLSQPAFTKIEQEIGNWWANMCEQELLDAGAEERKIAIEKGHYHEGVPYITVIADGGWSKRTHKHSYNALGGVGIIIGKETGKILHIGVRNKHCYICSHHHNQQTAVPDHICFRNWHASSQAMEADVIVDGFLNAEKKHGLRYMYLVADGDSSVYAKIREEVPIWGKHVQKVECANHACKCLRTNLEKLVETNPSYKGKNKLTKAVRIRLVSAVRCAIRMRSKEVDRQKASEQLAKDIRNSIHHIFGNHDHCSDFCKAKKADTQIPLKENEEVDCDEPPSLENICSSSNLFWTEGSSMKEQEQSRFGTDLLYNYLESNMLNDISVLLNRIANKSDRLIHNTTTNMAECWMRIRMKFDGGKVYNLCNRGSWGTRCFGGMLRQNLGPQWSPIVWRKCTGSPAGHIFSTLYNERDKQLQYSKKSKSDPKQSSIRWKRKMAAHRESNSQSGRLSYGQEALEVVQDLTQDQLDSVTVNYYEKHIDISNDKLENIERLTRTQSSSTVWHEERKKRITTSNFGKVLKRRPSIPIKNLVHTFLYSNFKGTISTRAGIREERNTVQEYILKKAEEGENVSVTPSGLIINPKYKFLGGSPDGIVSVNGKRSGILEIKNLLLNKSINLNQATNLQKGFCLKMEKDKLYLKENHDYFYQCQGLLHICEMPWIDFVVRTTNPYQLHIQRIFRDETIWCGWLNKLRAFYTLALLPELAAPRNGYSPGIREPGIWFKDNKHSAVKRKQPIPSVEAPSTNVTSPKPCTSTAADTPPQNITKLKPASRRSSRRTKFLGRRITHEWKPSESSTVTSWYSGIVTSVISGVDGYPNAVYEVLYDEEEEPFEIDHLLQDFESGSVKFIDI